jgi:hypothetical protein
LNANGQTVFFVFLEPDNCSPSQPVFELDGVSYIYLMHHSLYVVAITNLNADAALVLMFLHELLKGECARVIVIVILLF